jgi:biopolymer transport protein ExbD
MQGGSKDEGGITDINVTPLVDISLVLVIIFMVTAPMVVQSGIIVNSSNMQASEGKSSKDESVQVKITKKSIMLNNKKISDEQFPQGVKQALDANKKKVVMIMCDRDVLHGRLVNVLDVSKMMGAKSIAIMREEKGGKAE